MSNISLEDLFKAWNEFKISKRSKKDVQIFESNLEENLFDLYGKLQNKTYHHSEYKAFNIYDPKFRHIHKATVVDRIIHHALFTIIYPLFDKTFIFDSYSCRKNKGTHKAVKRLLTFIRKVSKNYNEDCFCLKLDVKQFFASVDHAILLDCLKEKMNDDEILYLLKDTIKSFSAEKGIPIGNLTSQIFANIYLNKLDQFIKHELKIKYYLRYCDDFVIVSDNKDCLERLIVKIGEFLQTNLKLTLHENKKIIRRYTQGIDCLGYIVFPHYILPRTKTKKRMFNRLMKKVNKPEFNQSLQSYLGYLSHANCFNIKQKLFNNLWFKS